MQLSPQTDTAPTNHSAVVLILGVGLGSEPFITELLAQGVTVVAFDKTPQLSPELLASDLSHNLIVLLHDFSDRAAVDVAVATYHVTHTLALPVGRALMFLGQINERYNFLGPRTAAIDRCTDKHKFHQLLTEHNLPAARYIALPPRAESLSLTPAELSQAEQLGFPLVVKPAMGSGSQGVRYCQSSAELAHYQVPERFASGELLLEQAIVGTEYSTNFFIDAHGTIHMLGLYAKELSPHPFRQEVAYFVGDYRKAFTDIEPVITRLVEALGPDCHNSFVQCDAIVTAEHQTYLVDVSLRLAGNAVFLLEQRYGINPITLFVRHILNHEPLPQAQFPLPTTAAALRFLSFSSPAIVQGFASQLSAAEQQHLVLEHNHLKAGDAVGPMSDGTGIKRGLVLVEHSDLSTANFISQRYLDSFELKVASHSSRDSIMGQTTSNPITYEDFTCCPLCGSKHFTVLPARREMIQATPLRRDELQQNAVITFTPALCEECGIVFNATGLSAHSRDVLYSNYKFIRPSTGMGAANYQTYIDTVTTQLAPYGAAAAIVEIGGYDGYLLQVLARAGYRDLTLIDPSAQTDCIAPELNIKVESDFFGRKSAERYAAHFDVIACKDTINMVPQLNDFIEGLVLCLKPGGTMVLTSVEPNSMHALQYTRLGRNAYAYIAHAYGLELVNYFKRPENTYGVAIFRKPTQPSTSPWPDSAFSAEQERWRPLLSQPSALPAAAVSALEHKVQTALTSELPIIVYGTGFAAFQLLDSLSPETQAQLFAGNDDGLIATCPRLILVNSSPEQEGCYFLLPNGKHLEVHYAAKALVNQHASLLIIGAQNPYFQQEIKDILSGLSCHYDDSFAL